LPLLRQALACSEDGRINRYVAETLFRHVWQDGLEPMDPQRLDALAQALEPQLRPGDADGSRAKALLRANTDAAAAQGVFGVPALGVDGRVFWGLDSLPMLRACLEGNAWFDGPDWDAAASVAQGLPV
jgi:2-hydroxychromene-2-carboxylate isomerase